MPTMVFSPHAVRAKGWAPQQARACSVQIHAPPLGQVPWTSAVPQSPCARNASSHPLLLAVCQSITGVAVARDFLVVNFSRTYLLLEPELFHHHAVRSWIKPRHQSRTVSHQERERCFLRWDIRTYVCLKLCCVRTTCASADTDTSVHGP